MAGLIAFAVVVATALVSPALASNLSHPATYTGSVVTGGTVEFDVTPDGTELTRFAFGELSLPPCGRVRGETLAPVAIVGDTFAKSTGIIRFSGSFPAFQQAQGTLTIQRATKTECNQEVQWTATTPTPPPDETPPETRIVSAPPAVAKQRRATFRFASTEPGSTFQCKRDGGVWNNCTSPRAYKRLPDGAHVFRVRATDAAGNVDPVPAQRRWRIEIS
ncbi:MAG TPA: hypothetical protein VIT89_11205 [Solirubrobacterales bacterium]